MLELCDKISISISIAVVFHMSCLCLSKSKEISKRPLSCHIFSYCPHAFLYRQYSAFYVIIKASCVCVCASMYVLCSIWVMSTHSDSHVTSCKNGGSSDAAAPQTHSQKQHAQTRTHTSVSQAAAQKYLFYFSPFCSWQNNMINIWRSLQKL